MNRQEQDSLELFFDLEYKINQFSAIKILMNNYYTHAYSEYVHHILNKSPSKTTYSFSKSERFPDKRSQHLRTEVATLSFENEFVQKSPQRKRISPLRLSHTAVGTTYRGLDNYQRRYLYLNPDQISKEQQGKGKSKSPVKMQPATSTHLKQREDRQPQRGNHQNYSQSNINQSSRGGKKSSSKSPTKKMSPTKTHTQILHEIDHVSKNQTHRGYYPTGVELSVNGKYPVSTIRNVPAHSFGKSEDRYGYKLRTSDPLGPGYYNNFSEFGQLSKK